MDIETCVTSLWKKYLSDPFLAFFSTHPSAQTVEVSGLIFSSISWHWQIGLCTCISTLYLYSKHSDPPSLYRVKSGRKKKPVFLLLWPPTKSYFAKSLKIVKNNSSWTIKENKIFHDTFWWKMWSFEPVKVVSIA